jgi:hypothetical protein
MTNTTNRETNELELRNRITARKLVSRIDELTVRPLTKEEITGMHSLVYRWHEQNNNANLQKAIERPANVAASKAEAQRLRNQANWKDGALIFTEEVTQEIQLFIRNYKQFDSSNLHDRDSILQYLKKNRLQIRFQEIVKAFEALTLAGTLTLIPEAIGLPESELTGYKLQHYDKLSTLLEPHPYETAQELEERRIAGLSSEEYKREFMTEPTSQREIKFNQDTWHNFQKAHEEIDFDIPEVTQTILDALESEGLGVRHDDLEYVIRTPKLIAALKALNAYWTITPSTVWKAPGGVSSLVDRRVEKPALPQREILIDEGPKKRWSRQAILAMGSQEYSDNIVKYGAEFERAVNEAF